jgi:hypothetical protein
MDAEKFDLDQINSRSAGKSSNLWREMLGVARNMIPFQADGEFMAD